MTTEISAVSLNGIRNDDLPTGFDRGDELMTLQVNVFSFETFNEVSYVLHNYGYVGTSSHVGESTTVSGWQSITLCIGNQMGVSLDSGDDKALFIVRGVGKASVSNNEYSPGLDAYVLDEYIVEEGFVGVKIRRQQTVTREMKSMAKKSIL